MPVKTMLTMYDATILQEQNCNNKKQTNQCNNTMQQLSYGSSYLSLDVLVDCENAGNKKSSDLRLSSTRFRLEHLIARWDRVLKVLGQTYLHCQARFPLLVICHIMPRLKMSYMVIWLKHLYSHIYAKAETFQDEIEYWKSRAARLTLLTEQMMGNECKMTVVTLRWCQCLMIRLWCWRLWSW